MAARHKGYEIKIDDSDLNDGIKHFSDKAMVAMEMLAKTGANEIEAYAKKNRKWIDRTGDARKRLTGRSKRTLTGFRIELAHGVDYGIWLEVANEGKYQIIKPTLTKKGKEVLENFKKFIEDIKL